METIFEKYKRTVYLLVFTLGFTAVGLLAGLIFTRPVFSSTATYLVTDTSGLHNEIVHPPEIRDFFRKDYFTEHLAEKISFKFSKSELKKMVKIKASRSSPTFRVKVTCKTSTDVYFIQKTIETSPRSLAPEMSDEYFLIIQIKDAKFPENPVRPGFVPLVIVSALSGAAFSVWLMKRNNILVVRNTSDTLLRFRFPVIARIPVYRKNTVPSGRKNTEFTSGFLRNSGLSSERARMSDTTAYNPDRNTIMINSKTSPDFFDAFRQFSTAVENITEGQKSIILVTSPGVGDGKTTVAINLGITAAATGKSVLLVDCNFRNRRLMRAFSIEQDSPGLYDMIFEQMPARDAILFTEYHSLCVLPQGNAKGINPLTLLTRSETLGALHRLKEMFDYIIIDSPPVNAYSDALALAGAADHVFLTIRNKITQDSEIEKALKSLELSEVEVTGFILNEAQLYTENPVSPGQPPQVNRNRFISGF